MRLDKKIITQGIFSVDNNENYSLAGSLEIMESGEIYLDCIHKIGAINSKRSLFNLKGEISEFGKVLLIDSFTISSNHKLSMDLDREKFFCNMMICVDRNHQGYDLKTTKMTFEIDDLEKWIAKPIINHEWMSNKKIYSYDLPEMEVINISNDLSLTLSHNITVATGNFYEKTEIRSKALAIFESSELQNLDFFIDKAITLSNLVSFALDSVCTIKSSYYGNNEKNKVIYQTTSIIKERKEINLINYFFTMKSFGDKSHEIIKNWFDLSTKIRPTISLYNQTKSKIHRYTEAEFLSLAQAAEALHRRTCDDTPMPKSEYSKMIKNIIDKADAEHKEFLKNKLSYGNEYSFRKRLELMLSVCWTDDKIKENSKLIKMIVEARNIFTHYPNRGDKKINTEFTENIYNYKILLENIIISNVLFLISAKDKNWTLSIMKRINSFRYRDF